MYTFKHLSDLDPKNHQSSLWYDGPVLVAEHGNYRAILATLGGVCAVFEPTFAQSFKTCSKKDQTQNDTLKSIIRKQARDDLELKTMLDGRHYSLNIDLKSANSWWVRIIDLTTAKEVEHKELAEDTLDAATGTCLEMLKKVNAKRKEPDSISSKITGIITDAIMSDVDNYLENNDGQQVLSLVTRILDMLMFIDEPRYTLFDYVDAVIHATHAVSLDKLLALDGEQFPVALIWLATDKRETYEDVPHTQEPLELDIYKN